MKNTHVKSTLIKIESVFVEENLEPLILDLLVDLDANYGNSILRIDITWLS